MQGELTRLLEKPDEVVKLLLGPDEPVLPAFRPVADLEVLDQGREFHLLEDRLQGLPVGTGIAGALQQKIYIGIGPHRGQLPGKTGLIGMLGDGVAETLVADVFQILQHPFDGAIFLDQLEGPLGADAGHPRDVVRRVAHEPQDLGHLAGPHAEALLDAGDVVGLVLHRVDHDDMCRRRAA